jgi:hypothetical protein
VNVSDNVDVLTPTQNVTYNYTDPVLYTGDTVILASTTDTAGNTATCTFTVTVIDTEQPQLTCPDTPVTTTADSGSTTATDYVYSNETSGEEVVTVWDNSGIIELSFWPVSGSNSLPAGDNVIVATATDPTGNTAMCEFIVTVTYDDCAMLECNTPDLCYTTEDATCTHGICLYTPAATGDACVTNTAPETAGICDGYGVCMTAVLDTTTNITAGGDPTAAAAATTGATVNHHSIVAMMLLTSILLVLVV